MQALVVFDLVMDWSSRILRLAALLHLVACTVSPESVVRGRAAADLSCPAGDLSVVCHGGKVFHMHEQFHCEARGCDKRATYDCEAALGESLGPIERRGDAFCR